MNRFNVTNDEIAEFVEGIAKRETVQRVLLAALADPQTRKRIELLRHADSLSTSDIINHSETNTLSEERLVSLQASLKESAQSFIASSGAALDASPVSAAAVVREQAKQLLSQTLRGGILPRIVSGTTQGLSAEWDKAVEGMRSLFIGRGELLTLPCLAPGAAAYAADLQVQRQTVAIAEGVRIEFQQLPVSALDRLRVVVDASALTAETRSLQPYNVAFLTLEEGRGGAGTVADNLPDRHILVIALNDAGRGYVDLTVGGANANASVGAADLLPAPRGAYSLISATLSRREN